MLGAPRDVAHAARARPARAGRAGLRRHRGGLGRFYRDPHLCTACRYRADDMLWRCPHCHEWNTFVERAAGTGARRRTLDGRERGQARAASTTPADGSPFGSAGRRREKASAEARIDRAARAASRAPAPSIGSWPAASTIACAQDGTLPPPTSPPSPSGPALVFGRPCPRARSAPRPGGREARAGRPDGVAMGQVGGGELSPPP